MSASCSPNSITQDTRAFKAHSENRKSDEELENSRKIYLFHTVLSPNSITQDTRAFKKRMKIRKHDEEAELLGMFIPKGSLSWNQLKLEHLRLCLTLFTHYLSNQEHLLLLQSR